MFSNDRFGFKDVRSTDLTDEQRARLDAAEAYYKEHILGETTTQAEQPKEEPKLTEKDYRKEVEKAVADIEAQLDKGNTEKNDGLIQRIADMKTEAEEKLEAGVDDVEEKARLEAQRDAADKWLDDNVRSQKADSAKPVTKQEARLRDAVVGLLRKAGIEVSTDWEAGQRVLDMANGKGVSLNKAQKRALETASVSENEKHQPTVVSSADGAKILNNLDTTAKEFENLSNQPKFFIGSVAKALGAKRHGSGSEYATFETKNGQIVTIRLANHNATVSGFDHSGRDNGISIVISPKKNKGIANDGNAHVVEFFYDAIKLRRAEGKPLAEIVRSIQQALYSGEYKDTTGLAEREEVNAEQVRLHKVFHGSGADFERFDHSHMGEGEGAQAYGWGTYTTEVEGIGRTYAKSRQAFSGGKYKDKLISDIYGKPKNAEEEAALLIFDRMYHQKMTFDEAIKDVKKDTESDLEEFAYNASMTRRNRAILKVLPKMKEADFELNGNTSILYTVEIPEDNGRNYLEWDKPLTDEQKQAIVEQARKEGKSVDVDLLKGTFQEEYATFLQYFNTAQGVSEFLHSAGFVGIKYPAQYRSGGREDGAKNYVIFNEGDLRITDKVKFFRTKDGEAYGFTVGGKIYLDPRIATAETPIHEYAHLWAAALRQANPKAWERLKKLMFADKTLTDWVRQRYPELESEDDLAEEVFTHYSGRRGAERLRAEQERMESETQSIVGKAKVIAMFENLRNALKRFWNAARELFAGNNARLEETSAEDFADMMMADLLSGIDPNKQDREYMEAVEKGDMEKAQRMVNEAVNAAMPETMVADKNGMPKVVLHGTPNGDFYEFSEEKIGSSNDPGWIGRGFYFYGNNPEYARQYAKGGRVMEVYLDIKNPYFATTEDMERLAEANTAEASRQFREELEAEGYDGVFYNGDLNEEWVAFYPSQIKSADPVTYDDAGNVIPLSERFNPRKDDIRWQKAGENIEAVNSRLNEELQQQIDGTLPKGHVYNIGMPSGVLKSAGIANLPIELSSDRLQKKSEQDNHPFSLDEVKDLPRAIHEPIAVFDSKSEQGGKVILTQLQHKGNNFVAVMRVRANGNTQDIDINSIRSIYPKDGMLGVASWINKGLMRYADKEKLNGLIAQSTDLAASKETNSKSIMDSAAKIVKNFENPQISGEENSYRADREDGKNREDSGVLFRSEDETPVFFSNAERAVENIKQERATPEQWVKMIEKQGGMKAGEDKWLGLSEWLKGSDAKTLTKGEVLDYIRANEIQVEEVEYGERNKEYTEYTDYANRYVEEHFDDFNREDFEEYMYSKYPELKEKVESGEIVEADNPNDVWFNYHGNGNEINSTRLSYTTEGLDNKREIVLTVPTIEPWNEHDEVHFGDAGGGRAVAWVRFGETTDKDGKRVLVIDEIQSNRHQEGREKGYKADFTIGDYVTTNKAGHQTMRFELPVAEVKNRNTGEVVAHIVHDTRNGDRWHVVTDNNTSIPLSSEKAALQKLDEWQNAKGVPDAPFDKNWHEVAMKRMLRFAAENGYDKVAWTKGEQQAERYNIGNVVDRIVSSDTASGTKAVDIKTKNGEWIKLDVDKDGNIISSRGIDANGKNLSDIVGKELASDIMEGKGNDGTLWDGSKDIPAKLIDGEGLRIGGEGMKGFYDKMLPAFMNKYGKKWGVSVGEVTLPNVEEAGRTMWSVDVTDDMRESVMRGQPLFRNISREDSDETTRTMERHRLTADEIREKYKEPLTMKNYRDYEVKENIADVSGWMMDTGIKKFVPYREIHPVPTLDDYYKSTEARFEYVGPEKTGTLAELGNANRQRWEEMKKSGRYEWHNSPRSFSQYLIDRETGDVYRYSDHWGKVASCYWELDRQYGYVSPYQIGKCNIKDFAPRFGFEHESENPKYYDALFEANKVAAENYKTFLDNVEMTDAVRRDVEGKLSTIEEYLECELKNYNDGEVFRSEKVNSGDWYERGSVERIGEFAGYTPKQIAKMNARQEESARNKFNETAEKLHLGDRITFVDTIDEIEGIDSKTREARRRKKGWYDTKTGKIVIILGNHSSMDDVMKSILHEGVAHHGLRQMFGKHFDTFLENVYLNASSEIRDRINTMAKKHGWDFREATEEYLATLAETTDFERPKNQSFWKEVKAWFLDMLHKIGIKLNDFYDTITDNELRYILWRSYENLKEPGRYSYVREAKDIARQYELRVGQWDESWNIEELEPNATMEYGGRRVPVWATNGRRRADRGNRSDRGDNNNSANREIERKPQITLAAELKERFPESVILLRDGDEDNGGMEETIGYYEQMVSNPWNQFVEATQNSMLSLKSLYKAILNGGKKFDIEEVKGYENAYLAENRMKGATKNQTDAWLWDEVNPLIKEIAKLCSNGKKYDKAQRKVLMDYMIAKHGLERNVVMAERDAKKAETEGKDYYDELQKNLGRDYAGLTALTGEEDVAAAETAAQQMVDAYEATHDVSELWKIVKSVSEGSLRRLAESGLISADMFNEIRNMYKFYIPLQGFDEKVAEDMYEYIGSYERGKIGKGTPLHKAKGRKSKADDPIATLIMNGEAAIRSANRNEMKQYFLRFVKAHPSELVSVSDVWLKKNDVTGEWEQYFDAGLKDGDSGAEVKRKVEAFEQRMEQLAVSDPEHYKKGSDMPNIPYRVVTKEDESHHNVIVKRGGKSIVMTINGNPRAAQALNGLTNPDVDTSKLGGRIINGIQHANRYLSTNYTSRFIDFMAGNFVRDAIYSNSMSVVKDGQNYAWAFHFNWAKLNPVHMGKLYQGWRTGELRQRVRNGQGSQIEKYFYEFMMKGGETGWMNMRDLEKHKKDLEKQLRKMRGGNAKTQKAMFGWFELANKSIENCARFAAYVTSREQGRSWERAIRDAKEVSVNFNTKGAGGKLVGATGETFLGDVGGVISAGGRLLFPFWNASVQGLANFGRNAVHHPGKFVLRIAAAHYILGIVAPMLSEWICCMLDSGGGDDDDKNAYYNLPEYVRRSNFCFRWSRNMPWITIPLPIELRSIYGMGELTYGLISGKEHYTKEEAFVQLLSQVTQILPLDFMEGGGKWWHAILPGIVKPGTEAAINESWTGLPIYRENPYNENELEWTKALSFRWSNAARWHELLSCSVSLWHLSQFLSQIWIKQSLAELYCDNIKCTIFSAIFC